MKALIVWFALLLLPFMSFAQQNCIHETSDIDFTVLGSGENNFVFLFADNFDDEAKLSVQNSIADKLKKHLESIKIISVFLPNEESDICWLRNFPESHKQSVFYYTKKVDCGICAETSKTTNCLIDFFRKNASSLQNDKTIVFLIRKNIENVYIGNYSSLNQSNVLLLKKNGIKNIYPEAQTDGTLSLWLEKQYGISSVTIPFELFENLKSKYFASLFKVNEKKLLQKENNRDLFQQLILQSVPKKCRIPNKSVDDFFDLLEKSFADPELLLLPNKKYGLTEKYIPDDLENLDGKSLSYKEGLTLRKDCLNALVEMTSVAKREKCNLQVISAFRSYAKQRSVFTYWVNELGLKEASRISARPETSQHQLGTTIDFNLLDESFENYPEGKWLAGNAYKYGFIMSFPKGMENFTGYSYEPWHYRYVGNETALLVQKFFNKNLELFLRWYWDLWQPLDCWLN